MSLGGLSSFGEDACGHLFAASVNGGVYRIQDGALSACPTGTPNPPAAAADGLAPRAAAAGLVLLVTRPPSNKKKTAARSSLARPSCESFRGLVREPAPLGRGRKSVTPSRRWLACHHRQGAAIEHASRGRLTDLNPEEIETS
jgi:hypothetical protein